MHAVSCDAESSSSLGLLTTAETTKISKKSVYIFNLTQCKKQNKANKINHIGLNAHGQQNDVWKFNRKEIDSY